MSTQSNSQIPPNTASVAARVVRMQTEQTAEVIANLNLNVRGSEYLFTGDDSLPSRFTEDSDSSQSSIKQPPLEHFHNDDDSDSSDSSCGMCPQWTPCVSGFGDDSTTSSVQEIRHESFRVEMETGNQLEFDPPAPISPEPPDITDMSVEFPSDFSPSDEQSWEQDLEATHDDEYAFFLHNQRQTLVNEAIRGLRHVDRIDVNMHSSSSRRSRALEEQSSVFDTDPLKKGLLSVVSEIGSEFSVFQNQIVSEVEKIVLLYGALREQGSWSGVAATIMLYIRTHCTGSIFLVMKQVFEDYFSCLEQHAGFGDFMSTLKMTHTNWKLATQNEGFSHISKLMSMLVGAGLVQATSIQCSVGGMKAFSDLSVPKFVSAYDLLDACMSCVVHFVEGGYECIQKGSLSPLLYNERDFTQFEDKFLECKKLFQYAQPGNYHMLVNTDENTVMKKMVETIEEGKRIIQLTKNPFSRKMLTDRLGKLQEMESTMQQHRLAAGVRMKPFCIVVHGPTGVGKSTVMPWTMVTALSANGFDASDDACIMMKAGQKHEENYRTYINGIYYDDFANTKPDFTAESPCEDLLETINTARCTARMATLELKNKVSKQPKVVVVSTNVKDLNATTYSEEPASITRRGDVYLSFKVRDAFATNGMLDSKKVEHHYGGNVPDLPDCWLVHIEISVPIPNATPGRADAIGWRTVIWEGSEMVNVDIHTAMQYIAVMSQQHFAFQKSMVERSTGLSKKVTLCEKCSTPTVICVCGKTPTVAFGDVTFNTRSDTREDKKPQKERRVFVPAKRKNNSGNGNNRKGRQGQQQAPPRGGRRLEEHALTDSVLRNVDALQSLSRFQWKWIVPQKFVRSAVVLEILRLAVEHPNCKYHVLFGYLVIPFILSWQLALLAFVLYTYFLYTVFMSYVYALEQNVANQRQAAWLQAKEVSTTIACILGTGVSIKIAYDCAKRYQSIRKLRNVFNEQAFMHPSDDDIREIDENDITCVIANEQNWAQAIPAPLPASIQSKTIVIDDLSELVKTNTAVLLNQGKLASNLFFVMSNVALVPTHMLLKIPRDRKYDVLRKPIGTVGSNFETYLSRFYSVGIPNADWSVVWVPNGGSWKDLTMYFPEATYQGDAPIRIHTRNIAGEIDVHKGYATHCHQRLQSCTAFGYKYEVDCFVGMCGAVAVAEKKAPMIIGVHVAGIVSERFGFSSAITKSDLEYAIETLAEIPGVVIGASEGTMKKEIYGKPTLDEHSIHPKSPVNRLDLDEIKPNFEVYGSCSGRATYYSKVVQSHISPHVTDVCGVPQKWGRPKFRKIDPWHEALKYSSNPSCGVEPSLLVLAVEDYRQPLLDLLETRPNVRAEIRPLTDMETVCGIDGKKFVNKIDPNTAVGYPLTGTKLKYLTYLDPADFEGFNNPAELDQIFWEETEYAIGEWAEGRRYYPTFKCFLKDEATPLNKDKVRTVQGAPMVLQLGVRRFFLPIARYLSLFPELSECAVGLNSMGPEWEEFQAHIKKFGTDRILAGDYSKYDLRMPAQLTFAAFGVLISIAEACGYSERDLKIMRSIATDVCYPVIAYNGDLLQLIGSNPSGHNLTVYINGIVNSLLLRCAWFEVYDTPFRESCALGTYGDDVKGSVAEGKDQFNHISVASFLADHDMKFTMPDKTSKPTPYMNDVDADFLKRRNTYIPELEQHVGALDEDSIFKSLHANLKSKALTKEELAAANIDGGLREWFYHGKEVYERRRKQMRTVAERAEISHMCQMLEVPFHQQVARWRNRYLGEPLLGPKEEGEDLGLEFIHGSEPLEEHSADCGSETSPWAEDMYSPCNGVNGTLFWWEHPAAFVLGGFFPIMYIMYLIFTLRVRFNTTAWRWYHFWVFTFVVNTFGFYNFLALFVLPHVGIWICGMYMIHAWYYA